MNHQTTVNGMGEAEGFSEELRSYWNALPNKMFFFPLLVAWVLVFQFYGNSTFGYVNTPSLFGWLYSAYNKKTDIVDDSHGNLIPFVVLALFWWRRKELLAQPFRMWWPGLLVMAASLFLHIVGYVIQQPKLSVVALFGGLYGLMGLAWGPAWLRTSFFPFFLFVFCIPLGSLTEPITFPLRMMVSRIVEFVGQDVLGINVLRQGTTLFKPPSLNSEGFNYEVAAACGGIRSLTAIGVIAIIFGFVTFKSNWKRVILIASAAPLAVIGNSFRLFVVVVVAEFWGKDNGLWVHDNTTLSLLPYIPAIAGLMLIGHWLERPMTRKNQPEVERHEQPTL